MISVNNVSKSFNGMAVLKNISLSFENGKIYCITGKSGCGKTTLLNIMINELKPDSGTVTGIDHKKISVCFQENRLLNQLNAIKNVSFAVHKADEGTIKSHLKAVALNDTAQNKPVNRLSGGMQRRICLVRAMLADAETVFMDEPLKGLDDTTRQLAIKYIKENIGGKTLIIITHDLRDINDFNAQEIQL